MDDKPTRPEPFWRRKTLDAMTPEEWESLCDGCGRCCLVKLEDEDTGHIHATDIGCRLFDAGTCRCKDYANRSATVPDCVTLTPKEVRELSWLPPTCAYRLVGEGRDLPWWHPLVSGDPETRRMSPRTTCPSASSNGRCAGRGRRKVLSDGEIAVRTLLNRFRFSLGSA
jgi:uncharacterized cysteine cluster protein YcgN (CxxCxxCC family)